MTPFPAAATLLQGLPHAAWLVALDSKRVVAANAAAAALFGRPLADLIGEPAEALAASPEDLAWWAAVTATTAETAAEIAAETAAETAAEATAEAAAEAAAETSVRTSVRTSATTPAIAPATTPGPGGLEGLHSDTVLATADGRAVPVSRSIGLVSAGPPGSRPTHALVVLADRSAEQRSEAEREALLSDLQATLEATADGILVTDLAGRVRAFNRRFAEIWGLPEALLHEHDDAAVLAWMANSVVPDKAAPGAFEDRIRVLRQAVLVSASDRLALHSGQVLDRVTRPLIRGGRPQGRVWSFRDLTERIAAEERVQAMALHDTLTGLANRRLLAQRVAELTSEVSGKSRRDGAGFALLFIDLDRFRQVNESLGHDTGDRVLLDVAQRIQGCLRQDDLLARVGGDQFAVLVGEAGQAAAEATARRVLNVVAQPCSVDGAQFTLTCSIGMALAPSQGLQLDDLVRHAEAAMRSVKAAGRANFKLHQARAEVDRRWRMKLDHAMRQALVSGRFRLHYQPQVDLASGAIVGAEALLRWRDPELGDVPPSRFIPVAEESGFIVAIGDWVLSQAVRQAALWAQRGHAVPIAVNVSALQFNQGHFVDRVASVLAVAGVAPRLLELELTESILLHDADEALHRLHALARLGVNLSIDDFGTGYSSLAYLKRFPIGKLKIDRSFVAGLPDDDSDAGIVRAILQMASALRMHVIAEGVETEAQRQFLLGAGCQQFQGFLYAPALDSLSFEQRLMQASPAPASPSPRMRLVRG